MVELLVAALVVSGGVFIFSSIRHHAKQRMFLNGELAIDEQTRSDYTWQFGPLEGAVTGVSIFDVLYNTARLDPFVLAGINHLHHAQEFQSLGDLISFIKQEIINSEAGSGAWRDMVHKYKGYTGEEVVFHTLGNDGRSVEVPESATHPGFDMSLDGAPTNVKITDSPAYIRSFLNENPDTMVYTNVEMKQAFADDPRVIVDETLSGQELYHHTNETFEAIDGMGSLINTVPLITLAFAGVKHGCGTLRGHKSIADAIEQTALDTAGVGGGGFVGSKLGLGVGLMFAPVTGGASAVVIPAATTIIGSIIGILTGKRVVNFFKHRRLRAAVKRLEQLADRFRQGFLQHFDHLVHSTVSLYDSQTNKLKFVYNESGGWFRRVFFPSTLAKFYEMACKRVGQDRGDTIEYYRELRKTVLDKPVYVGGMILYSQGKGIFAGVPVLVDDWVAVDEQVDKVNVERLRVT